MPLPEPDEEFLRDKGYQWELQSAGNEQLLIFHNYALPTGKYTLEVVDLLVKIPAGYPTTNPDMFFLAQNVLKVDGTIPQSVTQTSINSGTWNQWSRHYPPNTWRAGIDGLESYMLVVRKDLEKGI
ncbi:MAG: E2/UBC family protein [Chloroflexota bacterium]